MELLQIVHVARLGRGPAIGCQNLWDGFPTWDINVKGMKCDCGQGSPNTRGKSITAMHAISSVITLGLVAYVHAHGGHDQQPVAADADWATRHMAGEHETTTLMAMRYGLTRHFFRGASHQLFRRRFFLQPPRLR